MFKLDKFLHVLVIDDQEPSRHLARLRLADLGITRVHEAADGQEGLEYVAEAERGGDPVGLILCDHEMPEVNGFQFFRVLRQTHQTREIPFMMVTAHSEPALVLAMAEWGIEHYIVKPLSAQVLGEKIVKLLLKLAP